MLKWHHMSPFRLISMTLIIAFVGTSLIAQDNDFEEFQRESQEESISFDAEEEEEKKVRTVGDRRREEANLFEESLI